MVKRLGLATCAIYLALACQPAVAQQATPAFPMLQLDLDSGNGMTSALTIPNACGLDNIRTRLIVPRVGSHNKWPPSAGIMMITGNNRVILRATVRPKIGPEFVLVDEIGGKTTERKFRPIALNSGPAEIAIDWTKDGTVKVTVNGETMASVLPLAVQEVQFLSSTAQAKFSPLKIGRTSAAPPCPAG